MAMRYLCSNSNITKRLDVSIEMSSKIYAQTYFNVLPNTKWISSKFPAHFPPLHVKSGNLIVLQDRLSWIVIIK